jgi:hypothetical protein
VFEKKMLRRIFDIKEETHTENVSDRVLMKIFESIRYEVTGSWRHLYKEEFHKLYSAPSMIKMIMSRRMRCAGHVTGTGVKNAYRI